MNALKEDGYKIPKKLPVDYIHAKSFKDAKHILLSRIKQYGKPTQQGLYNYMADANMSIEDVQSSFGDLPGLDMEKFDKDFFQKPENKEAEGASEISSETYSNLVHKCPKCGFEFGKGVKTVKN